jgi:hypothetical protein
MIEEATSRDLRQIAGALEETNKQVERLLKALFPAGTIREVSWKRLFLVALIYGSLIWRYRDLSYMRRRFRAGESTETRSFRDQTGD